MGIADAYLAGVSTRRSWCSSSASSGCRRARSPLAKSLEPDRRGLPHRPLDGAPYAHVTLDALVVKCRKGGRTVDFCVGVNKDGFRESRGLDVVISEDGAVWLAYMPAWSPAYGIRARRTYADPRVTHDDRLNPL
ncbi:MAG: transposase [Actinobacteria bacterium]|nr:transposase [Actinomycetota bacterium]